jgi:outer membrane protein assembly factor BamB
MAVPRILAVEAATGKVLWQQDGGGSQLIVAGKFLYVTRAQTGMLDMMQTSKGGGEPQNHFRVRRLDPGDGRELWEYYQPRPPVGISARANRFLLLYPDKLQMVRFLAW